MNSLNVDKYNTFEKYYIRRYFCFLCVFLNIQEQGNHISKEMEIIC